MVRAPVIPQQLPAASPWPWVLGSVLSTVCFLVLVQQPVQAAPPDRTQSPYFLVHSDSLGAEPLPLKSTRVNVRLNGAAAEVSVTQTYQHQGQRPIAAQYMFPGSSRTVVLGMTLRQGGRVLPFGHRMPIANIEPGEEVQVELRYAETLLSNAGGYQFVFPAAAQAGADFDIYLSLPMQIARNLHSPSHAIRVSTEEGGATLVWLKPSDASAASRDFVLNYSLAGDQVGRGGNALLAMLATRQRRARPDRLTG